MKFQTNYKYIDRETKAKYVWLKYKSILSGTSILDVGADECSLKKHICEKTTYWGVGLGGSPDQRLDLDQGELPFEDGAFDCVLCLDVLEHLENIHQIFDECCRVTRRYLIISLPNPWANFYNTLRYRDNSPGQSVKFYGLPLEPPDDRHRWFFSHEEAKEFIYYRASKNGMRIVEMNTYGMSSEGHGWRRFFRLIAKSILFRNDLNDKNLYAGTLWALLEKKDHA